MVALVGRRVSIGADGAPLRPGANPSRVVLRDRHPGDRHPPRRVRSRPRGDLRGRCNELTGPLDRSKPSASPGVGVLARDLDRSSAGLVAALPGRLPGESGSRRSPVIAAAIHTRPGVRSAGCSACEAAVRDSGSSATGSTSGTGRSTSCSTAPRTGITGWPLFSVQCAVTMAIAVGVVPLPREADPPRGGRAGGSGRSRSAPSSSRSSRSSRSSSRASTARRAIAAAGEPPPISRAARGADARRARDHARPERAEGAARR